MAADPQLADLRRQLAALGYDGGSLAATAAPLAAALLGDLVRATDSYRELKAAAGEAGQAGQTAQYQVEVLRREVGRLTAENSRLHADLLREADARAALEAEAYQRGKAAEASAAELQYARTAALERAASLERERDGLKAKVRELLCIGQHHGGDAVAVKAALAPRMTITAPLEPRPSPAAAAKTSRGAISLIKAADSRILQLEADVRRREGELSELSGRLAQAQDAMARRDVEIQRLSVQLAQGPDVDALAQRYRNDANEAVILQLNQQVEALTAELTSVQERAVDRRTLEAAQQAQREAEARANALAVERESVAREVEAMQAALVRLQQEAAGEGAARRKLGALRSTLERVRAEKALLEGQLTHAETKVAELRDRLEQREAVLRKAQNRCKALEGELASGKSQQAQQQPQEQQQPSGGAEQQEAGAAELQAECLALAGQLEEARRLQQEAEALAAERQEQCTRLEQQVSHLQRQAAGAAAAAGTAADGPAEQPASERPPGEQEAAASPSAATLRQQLAEKASQLEQLEFERHELAVKLEESEKRVAALSAEAAAAKQQQQGPGADEASGKPPAGRSHDSDGSEQSWSLAAGVVDAGSSHAAQEALAAACQEADALKQRVQQLEGQVAALQTELAIAQAGTGGAAVADAAAADLRRQLQERTQEVADLSALSIKADATVQQYMTQLRSMTTELRAVQLRLGDAETQLARRAEEAQRRDAELAELRGIVGALDAERDALQAELDRRSEAMAGEASALAAERQRAEETQRALAAAEARLAAAASRVQEHEAAAAAQHGELEALAQHVAAVEAEYGALREEYRAVTDDLAALVRENQSVSTQLASLTAERQELADRLAVQATRCQYSEQLAKAREQDVAELRTAYEALAHESQRQQQSLTELTRELQARDTELATKAEEVASLHEAQRSAQSQINMYISDLQAYERQLEAMQRAMRRGDEAAGGLDRERQSLLEQLRTAEQVRFQLERAQEGLQRQLLHAEGGLGVLEARLEDAQSEADSLRQRVALEQARVGELEGLLAIARADQFKRDAVAAEAGPDRQLAALKEQRRLLEEQAATLQRQVDGLVQRREEQDAELATLRARLAGEFDAGATSGSRAAHEQGAELAAQLAEARQRCGEYAAEAESLRAQAAQLAGARDGAEAALQAATAELDAVKALLVQQEAGSGASAGGGNGSDAMLAQLEEHNRQLAARLEVLQAGAERHQEGAAGAAGQLAELQQENERLVELLGHMDAERSRLAAQLADVRADLVRLRATAPEPAAGAVSAAAARHGSSSTGKASGPVAQQAQQQVAQLEGALAAERQRRQQAERDFQELLANMDLLQSPSPTASSASGGGDAAHLAAALRELQAENEGLRAELSRSAAGHEVPFEPPSEVPSSWDPMASWLPQTPAQTAAPGAPASSGSGGKHRGIFAVAWSKVKRRFGRSGSKGGRPRGSSTEGGELLSTAGPSLPLGGTPGGAAVLHTTGSAPTPAATINTAFAAGSQSRIPKPPSGASNLGGRSASGGSAHSSTSFSRLPRAALPAPMGQPPAQRPAALANGGASPDPVRRLAFSPAAAGGRPGPAAASQPIPIAAAGPTGLQGRQGQPPGWQQQAQQAQQAQQLGQQAQHLQQAQPQQQRPASGQLPPLPKPAQQPAAAPVSGMRRAGSMPEPSNGGMPTPYATAPLPLAPARGAGVVPSGSSWGNSSGFAAQQLQLLGVPARSGLAGRWLREGGFAEEDGGAEVDFVLQIPQLQAAAREATRHLKVIESDGEMVLEWATQLRNGARILRPEAYSKSGALTTVPRMDGRAGTAATQLSFGIDGTVGVKTLQGPPVPALIHQKFKLSPDGSRLKISLKAQQLKNEWPVSGGAGGTAVAKQTTTWRRVHA
ncbi:basal body [Chlorella sorokiniana]|uniref:Basal body n=1 Tax=Chlorella sorokiniana TaxID=3076 RepID=A0A2P6TNJ7_CHLSO|nr:basal body [Chlorella sorokiniana]|eukprot:PRW50911.1 basal body [Chlorella sorokiniana]